MAMTRAKGGGGIWPITARRPATSKCCAISPRASSASALLRSGGSRKNGAYIGSVSGADIESQTIRIGKAQAQTFIAGIGNASVSGRNRGGRYGHRAARDRDVLGPLQGGHRADGASRNYGAHRLPIQPELAERSPTSTAAPHKIAAGPPARIPPA